jgi:hypothetical protein
VSYLLFIDESGQDHRESPYEVLAGVAIHDRTLWKLVRAIHNAEIAHFGKRRADARHELKARRLINRKAFRLAAQMPAIPASRRASLAAAALNDGANATREQLTALAQAKLAFCRKILELCDTHRVSFFASIVDPKARQTTGTELRKDYSYLFQRYFYFVDGRNELGLVVMDELDRSEAHLLVGQMSRYFTDTGVGKMRSSSIMPEPLFVHSDLTTGILIADIVAYVISWNVRLPNMKSPARDELNDLGAMVLGRRYRAMTRPYKPWSFALIHDLRPKDERDLDSKAEAKAKK